MSLVADNFPDWWWQVEAYDDIVDLVRACGADGDVWIDEHGVHIVGSVTDMTRARLRDAFAGLTDVHTDAQPQVSIEDLFTHRPVVNPTNPPERDNPDA